MNLGTAILNLKVTAAKCIEWLQAKTLIGNSPKTTTNFISVYTIILSKVAIMLVIAISVFDQECLKAQLSNIIDLM